MNIVTLILGIVIGVWGVGFVHEKFPETRPVYADQQITPVKTEKSIGTKVDEVLKVIQE